LQSVLFVGAGFVAVPAFETFLNTWLPTSITSTTLGKYAVRIGLVLGITALGRALMGKDRAKLVAIGGGAYVLVSAVKEFAPGVIPGLSAYVPPPGMGAYVMGGPTRQLRAFAPSVGSAFGGSVGGSVASTRTNVIPARFRRW